MATFFHPQANYFPEISEVHHKQKSSLWAVPIGRILFSLIFIVSGISHFSSQTISYATSMGVAMADILVPVSGLMAIIGGLSVMLGFRARVGALILLAFLVPVTFKMHAFWTVEDLMDAQNQMVNFMKNLGLIGGAILISFYGSGPKSLDQRQHQKRK